MLIAYCLSFIKDSINLSSLNSEFLSWTTAGVMCRCHLVPFTLSCGNWESGTNVKNVDTLATALAMSNKLSFVCNPGVEKMEVP